MGLQSITYPPLLANPLLRAMLSLVLWPGLAALACGQTITALTTPLQLPTSIAFDAQGDLYIAETNHHVVRRLDTTGALTTVAGDGTQGFAGDGGPATAAMLDSPAGVAVDGAGDVYIADAHNHRVRRVDGATGTISTVAGSGSAGFSGDGGAAIAARLNLPSALAVDADGNVFIADTNNHRIREVVVATGVMVTVAGNGVQGFSGDGGVATAAALDSPSGLAVDGAGNLYLADTHNQRVRMVRRATGSISTLAGTGVETGAGLALPRGVSVDGAGNVYVVDANHQRILRIGVDGTMATVAGSGTQTFSGDGGAALTAGLDTPRSVAVSPAGLVTLADTGNERVRQVSNGTITTVAGAGSALPEALTLTSSGNLVYGAGSLTATLVASAATGNVTFFEQANVVGTGALSGNVVTFDTAALTAGTHQIHAVYSGDGGHAPAQSAVSAVAIAPASLSASVMPVSLLYGQPVPVLSGTLVGVLAQDVGKVSLVLSTAAVALSPVGTYPISGALSGVAAGNYVLAPLAGAALTINKAASVTTIATPSLSVTAGQSVSVTLHVGSTTSGTPTGSVTVLDSGVPVATLALSSAGSAVFTSSGLAAGAHLLAAAYAGDTNFAGSTSAGQTISIVPVATGDFSLASTGAASQTIASGDAANFTFAVQMQGAALNSPIALAASTLPAGMTASLNPASLPPGGAVTSFTLTVQTSKAAARVNPSWLGESFAGVAVLLLPLVRRRRWAGVLALLALVVTVGCGDRVVSDAVATSAAQSYPITVTGTATGPTGAVLLHTATVTLNVQ